MDHLMKEPNKWTWAKVQSDNNGKPVRNLPQRLEVSKKISSGQNLDGGALHVAFVLELDRSGASWHIIRHLLVSYNSLVGDSRGLLNVTIILQRQHKSHVCAADWKKSHIWLRDCKNHFILSEIKRKPPNILLKLNIFSSVAEYGWNNSPFSPEICGTWWN